ncbi:MAG: hypothetical protein AUI14_18365 [Actinobacteria bacterium 13_2_20CM_2_71_6]|nr:MAG: hypothetical protein AUI14_18365 [Actinobacteria bacterium 13_2_20CM_2_71_6]
MTQGRTDSGEPVETPAAVAGRAVGVAKVVHPHGGTATSRPSIVTNQPSIAPIVAVGRAAVGRAAVGVPVRAVQLNSAEPAPSWLRRRLTVGLGAAAMAAVLPMVLSATRPSGAQTLSHPPGLAAPISGDGQPVPVPAGTGGVPGPGAAPPAAPGAGNGVPGGNPVPGNGVPGRRHPLP